MSAQTMAPRECVFGFFFAHTHREHRELKRALCLACRVPRIPGNMLQHYMAV